MKMHFYGFPQSIKGLKSPFHFEDGGFENDSATLPSVHPSVTLYFFWVFAVFGITAPVQMIE